MKKLCFTTMIAVFILLFTNGLQAQTSQATLNQVELMKQMLGSWMAEMGKDSTVTCEYKSFGFGMEDFMVASTKGKIYLTEKGLWGYDNKYDKFIHAQLFDGFSGLDMNVWWFTSNTICEGVQYQYISNPENAPLKWNLEFKSSDLMIMTTTLNSKVVSTLTFTREKK